MTRYIPFLDKHLPPLHDPVLELDPRMVFCAPTDHNQLIPCHNPQFRHPQGRDPVWNAAHARNRRKYTDKTAQAVAQNEQPFLLQTYRRDMGGGVFVLMKDASAPIRVNGRLWGGLRVCYKARSEEHTSELQSLMRNSYAVFCLKKKKNKDQNHIQLHK